MKNLKLYFSKLPKTALLKDLKAMKGVLTMKFLTQAYNTARKYEFDYRFFKTISPQDFLSNYFIGPPMQ